MKYKIYQLKDLANCKYGFMSYNFAKKRGFNIKHYEVVYEGELEKGLKSTIQFLDYLFMIFNTQHPKDFKGHSLSVSDIVEFDGKMYYCDSYGWEEIK